ncbi:SMP-30/gluconolactonase/LRE family protein, partial [Rhizobiaceae sp. 2RAB30]
MTEIKLVVDAKNKLGEVPVWDVEEQALYWVDIEGSLLQRLDASGGVTRWQMPERICSFALRKRGGLVVALASTLAFFDPESGTLERLPPPNADMKRNRLNDGKCDRRGRFWVGSMDDRLTDRTGGLFRLDPDGSLHQ